MSDDKKVPADTASPAAAATTAPAGTPAPTPPGPTVAEAREAAIDATYQRAFQEQRAARAPGKRLFVGARLSTATANALAAVVETMARRAQGGGADIRWVAPVNYHVTLKFLGWTREAAVGAVRDALVEALRGTARLTYRTARIGAFGSVDKANVVWAGIDDAGAAALAEVAARIEDATERLGYPRDRHPFHPHVTIGRLRETRSVREVVLPVAEQMFGGSTIDSVSLFESETKSSGSVYTELARIGFEPAATTPERQTRAVDLDAREDTDDGWPRGHTGSYH